MTTLSCANPRCERDLDLDHVTLVTTKHVRRFCSVECIHEGHQAVLAAASDEATGGQDKLEWAAIRRSLEEYGENAGADDRELGYADADETAKEWFEREAGRELTDADDETAQEWVDAVRAEADRILGADPGEREYEAAAEYLWKLPNGCSPRR